MVEPLEFAGLRLALGYQAAEELPYIAADALVRGLDSPSLRMAAGAAKDEPWEARECFWAALSELGVPTYSGQDALWRLARHHAECIVQGTVDPHTGARAIWSEVAHQVEREGDLRIFIGLASEMDDHPEARTELGEMTIAAARELLTRSEPRDWLLVMAEHGQVPTWKPSPRESVSPSDLPIPDELAADLIAWAAAFDAVAERLDPPGWGFEDPGEAERFVAIGQRLVERLQDALGDGWHVEYMPVPTQPFDRYPPAQTT